jgi:hypothetical protein
VSLWKLLVFGVIILSIALQCVVMLSVCMQGVIIQCQYSECCDAACLYKDGVMLSVNIVRVAMLVVVMTRVAECHYALNINVILQSIIMPIVTMPSIVIPNFIMLCVLATKS